jgi:hypothetical protein
MNNSAIKAIRKKVYKDGIPYREYTEHEYHHRYNGKDRDGNNTYIALINPIKLTDRCLRKLYKKEKRNASKSNI